MTLDKLPACNYNDVIPLEVEMRGRANHLPDDLQPNRATGVVLMLDESEDSKRIEQEFAAVGVPHVVDMLRSGSARMSRPAVWFRAQGRPELKIGPDQIRKQFLQRFGFGS